jgi:hypothetical protein
VIWIAIGLAVMAWFIGLLIELGPAVHLLLVLAVALLVVEIRRTRTESP